MPPGQRLFIFVVFAAFLVLAIGSHEYRHQDQTKQAAAEHPAEQNQIVASGDINGERLARYTFWLVAFTGILAVATIGLGYATYKLWEISTVHADHMEDSVKEARVAAKAAERAADNAFAIETARLFVADIDVSINSGPMRSDSIAIMTEITVRNLGRTPAILAASAAELRVCPILPEYPNFDRSWGDLNYGRVVIAPNEFWKTKAHLPDVLSKDEWKDIQGRRNYLWLYGTVVYWDILHCENRYYFCAQWWPAIGPFADGPNGRFIQWEVENYSYYYRNPYPGEAIRVAPIHTALPREKKTT
jgi:hypothetical protein